VQAAERIEYINRVLSVAYANLGVSLGSSNLLSLNDAAGSDQVVIEQLVASARKRLNSIFPEDVLLQAPTVRSLSFDEVEIKIAIVNEQGREWYLNSDVGMFDFTAEADAGLLPSGGVIFDIGAHQGVWSMFYCLRDKSTTVFCFEPSIINVEVICMNMLINDVKNLRITPSAVGVTGSDVSSDDAKEDMLVDFVGDRLHVINFQNFAAHQVDFAKVDIEGFEFDLIMKFQWFFDFARHYHLELHIPHLERRGVDYREAFSKIPFDKFDVTDWQTRSPVLVERNTELSGYTTLMLKRKIN
jgi:FkbM family methyltransferase